jgi:hypothetical protein
MLLRNIPDAEITPSTVKQMIADVLDVTKFDCSEAVNEALLVALPGIIATVKAELEADDVVVTAADVEAQTGVHDAMLGVKPTKDTVPLHGEGFKSDQPLNLEEMQRRLVVNPSRGDPADITLEELERLTAPDPVFKA